jgi:hypothetical protein
LDDQPPFVLAEDWSDRAHDSFAACDRDSVADVRWLVLCDVPGRNDLFAAAEFVEEGDWTHLGQPA